MKHNAPKWTPEQQLAIDARGASVLVSAAAGSGKTAVLVARLTALLTDEAHRLPADRIVVVTYTKAAAAELKARLQRTFAELCRSTPDNRWLRQQQLLLPASHISTVHTFCFELLREYGAGLGLSPKFKVLDQVDEQVLRSEVMEQVLGRWYREQPAALEYLRSRTCRSGDQALTDLILSLYQATESIPWGLEQYADSIGAPEIRIQLEETVCTQLERQLRSILQQCRQAAALAQQVEQPKLLTCIAADQELLETALANCKQASLSCLGKLLNDSKFPTFPSMDKNCPAPEIREAVKQLRDHYKDRWEQLKKKQADALIYAEEDFVVQLEFQKALLPLLKEFHKKLTEQKLEQRVLGFGDAEQYALRLLAHYENGKVIRTPLAEELSHRFSILMIDEYQDSNDKQDLIFRLLSQEGTPETPGNNLFLVGDVKQSIYGFRYANPENFLRASRSFSHADSAKLNQNSAIRLNRNFRSSQEVIAFVNRMFSLVMTEQSGGISYADGEALIQGTSFPEADRSTGVLLSYSDSNVKDLSEAETSAIAAQITDMLRTNMPVSDRGSLRPCRPSDFCILFRKRGAHIRSLVQKLQAAEIPVLDDSTEGYLEAREISLLLNLLRVIDNPLLDTALAAVLLSPLFLLNADELTTLRLCAADSLYSALCAAIGTEERKPLVEEPLRSKLQHCYTLLTELRQYAACESTEALIRRIYESTDFLSVMLLHENGTQKRANLRMLLTHAKKYEAGGSSGISGFLRYVSNVQQISGDFQQGSTVSGSEDAVRIMTIHNSKGLEYPFVFLAMTWNAFSKQDDAKRMQFRPGCGAAFRLYDPEAMTDIKPLAHSAISALRKQDSIWEELRLLYVACTRAKERLFLSMPLSESIRRRLRELAEDRAAGRLPEAGCMADWIWYALCDQPQLACIPELSPAQTTGAEPLPLIVLEPQQAAKTAAEKQQSDSAKQTDLQLVQALRAQYAFQYPGQLVGKRAKCSVTSLTSHAQSTLLRRPSFLQESGMTGAEAGTALHRFLQHIDIQTALLAPEQELARLKEFGILSQEAARSISMPAVRAFCSDPLFRRIAASQRVWRERTFLLRMDEFPTQIPPELSQQTMLMGMLDLLFEENGKLVLVDYKTDRCETPDQLRSQYAAQLKFYRAAIEVLEQLPVQEVWIYSFHLRTAILLD